MSLLSKFRNLQQETIFDPSIFSTRKSVFIGIQKNTCHSKNQYIPHFGQSLKKKLSSTHNLFIGMTLFECKYLENIIYEIRL